MIFSIKLRGGVWILEFLVVVVEGLDKDNNGFIGLGFCIGCGEAKEEGFTAMRAQMLIALA